MKRLILVVLAAAVLVVPASSAEGATPRCRGERATLVGSPGQYKIKGTPGRDVIVTNGSGNVTARAGNDLICVTGSAFVDDGRGDDLVDASRTTRSSQVSTTLWKGDDTYLGGPGEDSVHLHGGGRDRVTLGGYNDHLDVAKTSPRSSLAMGGGADTLWVDDADATFHVDGGDGHDRVFVGDEPKDVKDDYVLDNTTGTLEVDGTQKFSWTSFEEFIVHLLKLPGRPAPSTRFRFLGAATAETLDVAAHPYSDSPLAGFLDADLDLGGGEDHVTVNGTADGVIDMGDGHDVMKISDVDSVDADLAAGTIDIVRHMNVGTRRFGVAGIEDLTCSAYVSDNCERP